MDSIAILQLSKLPDNSSDTNLPRKKNCQKDGTGSAFMAHKSIA